jgi:hypothetical protein
MPELDPPYVPFVPECPEAHPGNNGHIGGTALILLIGNSLAESERVVARYRAICELIARTPQVQPAPVAAPQPSPSPAPVLEDWMYE